MENEYATTDLIITARPNISSYTQQENNEIKKPITLQSIQPLVITSFFYRDTTLTGT